jgi:quinol monooxygenase YgiN
MVLERAEIFIKEGMMDAFVKVLNGEAIPLTRTFTGILSFKAMRGVEEPNSVMFLAEWPSIEVHLESRPEPAHAKFRELVLPFVDNAKVTTHYQSV